MFLSASVLSRTFSQHGFKIARSEEVALGYKSKIWQEVMSTRTNAVFESIKFYLHSSAQSRIFFNKINILKQEQIVNPTKVKD